MNMRRSGAAVQVYENKIYVAGGHDGPLIHNSVECYDMSTNKWTLITEMNTCRRNAGKLIVQFEKFKFYLGRTKSSWKK